jgi:hypothetical protein
MSRKWVVIGGTSVAKNQKKRYTRNEVEQILRKAARAAGVAEAKIGPTVQQILPEPRKVSKSTSEIEAERRARHDELQHDLERQRQERLAKMRDGSDRLSRMLARDADSARAPIIFAQPDGSESSYDGDGAVTRLDLHAEPVKRARRGLFGDVVDAGPTQPYTP